MVIRKYIDDAVSLLRQIVAIPSCSFEEEKVADFLCSHLKEAGLEVTRIGNNITSKLVFAPSLPTLMLCAHIDTVKAADSYTFDPYNPPEAEDRILGLGSNDDGGSVVSMIATFLYFRDAGKAPVNLYLLLSCEEERSGKGGTTSLGDVISANADFAIVGEPTCMEANIAEKGLLVIDGTAYGRSAHAARAEEGDNAIYTAIRDIETLRSFRFDKVSPMLGEVKLSVTGINAGTVHNVIPEICTFMVDIRPNECYTNEEIFNMLQASVNSTLKPRNLSNRSSATPADHPLIKTAEALHIPTPTSATTSDWMRLPIPAIKMGPGDSHRSHKADEYILKSEISEGIERYIEFISNIRL